MSKPKGVNQKAMWRAHNMRLSKYADMVQSVYDTLGLEVSKTVLKTDYDGSKPFRFSDYPATKKKFDDIRAQFVSEMRSLIYSGTTSEWKESNLVQDLLADKTLKSYGIRSKGKKYRRYYQSNNDALKAFQRRKDDGMNLSQKLWNQSSNYKEEMEYCLSSAIENGTSAVKLSKKLSKYLNDFPSLKKDYKEKFGKAVTCQDCEYRSMRLARSEINMAYRKAEQERWKQFDFVLGYEIKLTQNGWHKPDICDELAGKYPKDFVFLGWHPNCMCYVVPILKSEEQFWNEEEVEPITETPDGFDKWLKDNAERIEEAKEKGTLPYWYEDNEKYITKDGGKKTSSFDVLAIPDSLSAKDRKEVIALFDLIDEKMNDVPEYRRQSLRFAKIKVREIGEILSSEKARKEIIDYYGSIDDFIKDIRYSLERDHDISYQVEGWSRYSDFKRTTSPFVMPPKLPNGSLLPNDMKMISEYLNSFESVEMFYVTTGYKSYDEFFEAIGGIVNIEKKLKSLAKESRVYMCMDDSTLDKIIKGDGKIKNSLETGKGTFKTIGDDRAKKEQIMFGLKNDADYDVMPKYGFVAGKETMDYEDIVGFGYGDTYVRFKDAAIRRRTTVTCGDSYDGNRLLENGKGFFKSTPITPLENPDSNFALGILSHSGDGADVIRKLSNAVKLSDISTSTYIEAQIYGVLRIEDVDAIYVQSKKQLASLTKALKKNGLDIELLPCKYDTRLKLLEDGFTNYSGKATKYAHSLTNADVDSLGDFYINGLCKRFADPKNGFWKKIGMPDDFMESMGKIAEGSASMEEKRMWLKSFYEELRKKNDGKFPKVWWQDYAPSYGGWTSDVLNESLLKGPQ